MDGQGCVCLGVSAVMAYVLGHVIVAELPLAFVGLIAAVILLGVGLWLGYRKGWLV